jgi:4-nitrophenyl phosphatase
LPYEVQVIDPADVRALILDMDGVLWRGSALLDGVRELFQVVERRKLACVVATNNATVDPASVVDRLARAGVAFPTARVLTSADVAGGYLARSFTPPTRVHVIGEEPLRRALTASGCQVVDGDGKPQAVVVGMDRRLDWAKLTDATLAIRAGAVFIGTNPDRTFPSERGIGPGNGAVLAALEAATGVAPVVVGKPEPHLFIEAARRVQVNPDRALVVGDRLETDILGGQRAGMPTALILTGVTSKDQLSASTIQPDVVLDDLPALAAWLKAAP